MGGIDVEYGKVQIGELELARLFSTCQSIAAERGETLRHSDLPLLFEHLLDAFFEGSYLGEIVVYYSRGYGAAEHLLLRVLAPSRSCSVGTVKSSQISQVRDALSALAVKK